MYNYTIKVAQAAAARKPHKFISLLMLGLITLAGCSNTAVIREKDVLIEEQRISLSACDKELTAAKSELQALRLQHQEDKADAERGLLQCQKKLDEQVATDLQLLKREKELRARLATDINNKNIEIENLKGRLSLTVLDKILFRSGSVVIQPDGRDVLKRVAASLADSNEKLLIEGHTDDVLIGTLLAQRIYSNWELSALRAASVVRFLESNNIDSVRLSAVGHSMFKPVASNDDETSRQLNRRVEIVVVPDIETAPN